MILLRLDSYSTEVQTDSPGSPDEAGDYVGHQILLFISNSKALASRFIQIFRRPEHLAPVILDFLSMALSIVWTERQSGPDILYPFSSLKKQKSGRLARLLLEHSKDQLDNLHDASSPRDGVDPPRVVVIDLDEAPPEIIERGYTVADDFYGFVVMVLLLHALLIPINPHLNEFSGIFITIGISFPWIYAGFRGEGTITLVRISNISTRGCAVLLDRDFTVILTGTQSIVEAIAQSSFSMSHIFSTRRYQLEFWQVCQCLLYEALKAWCQGLPLAILAEFWLLLGPTSLLAAFVPLAPAMVVSFARASAHTIPHDHPQEEVVILFLCGTAPTFLLIFIYQLVIVEDPLLRILFHPATLLHLIPFCFLIIHFISSQNGRIRTAKLLDILGRPPVRRWEFDTFAAAATFQCLVLCGGIPRPVKRIDVLALLDIFVPDQTDVWKVWKARVADRIAHEEDISFAPTVPSFGDQRQKHLKELLDEAQIGYGVYTAFYDRHVPIYSTIAL